MISDFEVMRQAGLKSRLEELASGTFAIICDCASFGENSQESADDRRPSDLKKVLWASGYGFISTQHGWKSLEDETSWGKALLIPDMNPEQALSFTKGKNIQLVLIGSEGTVQWLSRAKDFASVDPRFVADLLDLIGDRGAKETSRSAPSRSAATRAKLFFSYAGRPPTGLAKYGLVPMTQGQPLPVSHFSTLIEVAVEQAEK